MSTLEFTEIKSDIREIKTDINDMKLNLAEHMSRTAASEARLDLMEGFIRGQTTQSNETMDRFITMAEKHALAQARLIKSTLGIFAAISILVGVLWQINQ